MDSDPETPMELHHEPPSPESREIVTMEEAMLETAQSKERLGGAIQKAKETIKNIGYLPEEIGKIGKAYLDIPIKMVGAPFHATSKILHGQPLVATKEIAKGLSAIIKDIGEIAIAPARLAVSATKTTAEVAKKIIAPPLAGIAQIATSPIRALGVIGRGAKRLVAA